MEAQTSNNSGGNFTVDEDITDVNQSARLYLTARYGKELKWGIIAGIIFDALLLYALIATGELARDGRALMLLLIPFGLYAAAWAKIKQDLLHQFYRQFAQKNGFSYQQKGWIEGQNGAAFLVGHGKIMEDILQGEIAGLPLALFNYRYTVGSGKNSRTYNFTVLDLDLKTPVPPMLLLVDRQYFGDDLADNNLNYPSKIELPQNQENIFNLYCEKEYEIEALQIFTPEFLNRIAEKYRRFSLDFVGTKIYIYSSNVITDKAGLMLLKEFAGMLAQKLSSQLPAMKGSITALAEALSAAGRPGLISKAGWQFARLSGNKEFVGALLFALIFAGLAALAYLLVLAFIK